MRSLGGAIVLRKVTAITNTLAFHRPTQPLSLLSVVQTIDWLRFPPIPDPPTSRAGKAVIEGWQSGNFRGGDGMWFYPPEPSQSALQTIERCDPKKKFQFIAILCKNSNSVQDCANAHEVLYFQVRNRCPPCLAVRIFQTSIDC